MTNKQRAEIRVVGVVQGIGFRPFIYGQATKRKLTGSVLNTGNSAVEIIVEGNKNKIIEFIESIEKEKPTLAVIDRISINWAKPTGKFTEFTILISRDEKNAGGSIIPADISVCEECIQDIRAPQSRHYQYPMTCCAICGPRYTTIVNTPYDRERTTMDDFPLCSNCEEEYYDPSNRRYNAQTICCPECGPKFQLLDPEGTLINTDDVFGTSVKLLNEGAIIAIKGLGGIHLAVRASLEEQIQRLRKLRGKPNKPLAIMAKDIKTIRKFAVVTRGAQKLLTSWRRPIVVLRQAKPFALAPSLAPGLDTIGVMLPYSGIYLRLFEGLVDQALVMTSANPVRLPTIIHATTFQEQFIQMADYLLTHNRTIYQRSDDSVVLPVNEKGLIIRRSRGYTPEPIESAVSGPTILAVGALEKNTGAIYHKRRIYLTQHIGDVDTLETMNYLRSSIAHLQNLLRIEAYDAIACDLHPDFLTTHYAEELAKENGIPLIQVQHHFAHLASLQVDHKLPPDEDIVAICCDGAGYGEDGTTWGGEILVGNAKAYRRAGYLRPQPMPGGDLAARYPLRMLMGILSNHYSPDELFKHFTKIAKTSLPHGQSELRIVLNQITEKLNTPLTSSTGRILDALSALLGVCYQRTYEGEPAIRFEAFANSGTTKHDIEFSIPTNQNGSVTILETGEFVNQIFQKSDKFKGPDLALAAHQTFGRSLAQVAIEIANQANVKKIGFSGGVAYNKILTRTLNQVLSDNGFTFLMHHHVPPGDAGTSTGQAFVAREQLRD